MLPRILIVDDEKTFLNPLSHYLKDNQFHVKSCLNCEEALLLLRRNFYDIIICDVFLPFFGSQEGGLEIAREVADKHPSAFTIIVSQYVTDALVDRFMDSVTHKKYRFLTKSDDFEDKLLKTIKKALEEKFIFVCMPFSDDFKDIYEFGIKQAANELNFKCERADEMQYSGGILDKIYSSITSAHIIIADMTTKNPNVFYEVGYAHALGKEVILLTQNAEDIPTDLRKFNHIAYKGKIHELKDSLIRRIEAIYK